MVLNPRLQGAHVCSRLCDPSLARAATQTNKYMGFVHKFHKGIDYIHIIIHVI